MAGVVHSDRVLAVLADTGADVRPGTDSDTVDGLTPAAVAAARNTEQVSAVLRAATGAGLTVVARGTGTRLGWGAALSALDVVLHVSAMDRVLAHQAGDLVLIAEPGVRVATLVDVLAEHGQRLALDGTDHVAGTLGGTVATATAGPLRYRYGTVRDLLIGITVVLADGTVTKSGGTVVKNVAGYDLGKLYTGSFGTLGVITELVFRLHPLPDAARWITARCATASTAAAALAAVRGSQNDPVSLEVDRPEHGGACTVGVAVEGAQAGIDVRAEHVAGLLTDAGAERPQITDTPPSWWGVALRGTVAQLTAVPTGLAEVLDAATGPVRGSAGAGVLQVALDPGRTPDALADDLTALRVAAARHHGAVVLRSGSAEVKAAVDPWGPVPATALMRRLKDEFDPEHRLAPGRAVGDRDREGN